MRRKLELNVGDAYDLHPFTKLALELVVPLDATAVDDVKDVYVFPDGSADVEDGIERAGWGLAVVASTKAGGFAFLGCLAGPVATSGHEYVGADQKNWHAAELSGMLWAIA